MSKQLYEEQQARCEQEDDYQLYLESLYLEGLLDEQEKQPGDKLPIKPEVR